MSRNEVSRGRIPAALVALAAAAATIAALAAPAGATVGQGAAVIKLAQHNKGRTLSGQDVQVTAAPPATQEGDRTLTLPTPTVDFGAKPSATVNGGLRFKKGGDSVWVLTPRFDLTAGTLVGKVGDTELPIFKLGAAPVVNSSAGTIQLNDGKLRLTAEMAELLQDELDLDRALVHKGVGMLWLNAKANPTREAAKPIASGTADWGFATSFREYVYKSFGPGSVGSITTEGGATTTGLPAAAGSFFSFPAIGGSFEKGLYGASDLLVLKTQGSVKFAKPGHCINEIKFTNLVISIDGANSSITADLNYDVDKVNGKTCEDLPPVSAPSTVIATVNASGLNPTISADGKTVSLANLSVALTAAGAVPFGSFYKAGAALDPITITAGLG